MLSTASFMICTFVASPVFLANFHCNNIIFLSILQREAQRSLPWYQDVRESHTSFTVKSFSEAEAANSRGVYTIGVPETNTGGEFLTII